MDSLTEIPRDNWPRLRDSFKARWPRGVVGANLLAQQLAVPLDEYMDFKVYCPYGDIGNGMVATVTIGNSCEVIVEPNTDSLESLLNALRVTKVLKWTKDTSTIFVDTDILKILTNVFEHYNVKVEQEYGAIKHLYRKESPIFDNVRFPEGTYMSKLRPEHLELVNLTWPYHGAVSAKKIQGCIDKGQTYALYSTEEQLLAWMLVNECGAFCHLYCLPGFRRHGFAQFIVRFATNDLLSKNRDALVFTDEKNTKSMRLFRKLGFEVIGWGVWQFFAKPCFNESEVQ